MTHPTPDPHTALTPPEAISAPVAEEAARVPLWRRLPVWAWIVIGVVAALLFVVLSSFIAAAGLTVMITGIVALAKNRPTWLAFPSRRAALIATIIAAVVFVIAGSVSAATRNASGHETSSSASSSSVERRGLVSAPIQTEAVAARPVTTPTPTPVTVTTKEKTVEAVPFAEKSVESADIPKGETRVTTEGVAGERTIVYAVTTVDGVETDRTVVSDTITVAPVDRVTAVGTYEAPVAFADTGGDCDPNYADACVPIASDVDCGGGSGNGPAYLYEVARVVGTDIYDLDRDGDGLACE